MTDSPTALILVDHGSRVPDANDLVHRLAGRLSSSCGERFVTVEPAHMELATPTIADAVARCLDAGARRIVVSLLFLTAGRHVREDVPALVEAALAGAESAGGAASERAGVTWVMTGPLADHPRIAEALLARVDEVPDDS